MTQFGAALDALRIGAAELAVRTGADAEVVAEQPIVEIVPAAMSRARVSGDLVLRITLLGKTRLTALLHLPRDILVGQARRRMSEVRVGPEGELVVRDVRGLQGDGMLDDREGLCDLLSAQAKHQFENELREAGCVLAFHRGNGLARAVVAPEPLQH